MRARTAIAWTSHRVRLTAVGWGLTTMLACVALSACTSGPASTPPPSTFIPSAGASSTATGTASGGASPETTTSTSASASSSASTTTSTSTSTSTSASPSESQTPSPEPSPSPSPSPVPDEAPVTGGGGTAGFQDAGLAVLGGAAIVAGLGGIAYRRRITKDR